MADKSIAIIGGGITGLATAWYLEEAGFKDITLVEAIGKLGGKIQTETSGGFVVEAGPDGFMKKAGILDFVKSVGLEDELTEPQVRNFYILHKQQLKPVPEGLASMVPSDMKAFFKSDLISWKGKMRLMMERFVPAKNPKKDESLARFVKRRFGREILEKVAEPLFSGVYSAPADELSIKATFPHFKQMEAKYGSITKAVLANRKQYGVPQSSPFRSFKNGMQTLPKAIENQLNHTKILRNTAVHSIQSQSNHYQIQTEGQSQIPVNDVILTIASHQAISLLNPIVPGIEKPLKAIPYTTSVIVTLAYERTQIGNNLDATGFLIPSSTNTELSACTWSSEKWANRAPKGHVLLRCFFKTPEEATIQERSKEDWARIAHQELQEILDLSGNPGKSWLHIWQNARPQYKMGHLKKIKHIEEQLADQPGVHLAGSPYRGVGIPDCVKQAKEVAERINNED